MRIWLHQCNVIHSKPELNTYNLSQKLSATPPKFGDLILLPELFNTGYLFHEASDAIHLGESIDNGKTIQTLKTLTAQYQCAIAAGFLERDGHHLFNSVIVLGPDSILAHYRKQALTNIDKQLFNRGQSISTFEYQGVNFGIALCFDLWFPELIRQYVPTSTDILLHPSNFGGPQSSVIAQARAIENNMTVITCNRIGQENTNHLSVSYCGNSQVVSPSGEILLHLGQQENYEYYEHIPTEQCNDKRVIGVNLEEEIHALQAHQS